MTIDFNFLYPMLFILIILAGFGIYHIVLTIIANRNSQDTTTKMQFMYEKSTDNQKELQIDSTDKIYRLADSVVKLDYTSAEAKEAHDINKKIKKIEKNIEELSNKLELIQKATHNK